MNCNDINYNSFFIQKKEIITKLLNILKVKFIIMCEREKIKMPKVSVIIPIYNSEKYLRQCLDSVINQTLKDIEIICVNDGSTDSSKEILEEYAKKDERITVINQKNSYVGVARNNGIKIAKGDYIHFLDSDDWLKSKKAYEYLYKKMKNNDVDIIIFQHNKVNIHTGKEKKYRKTLKRNNQISNIKERPDFFISNNFIVPWNKLYNRKFIIQNKLKFDTIITAEDRIFYLKVILLAKKIMVCKKSFIYYRVNNKESLTGETRLKNYECHFKAYEIMQKICASESENIQKRVIDIAIRDFLYFYHKANAEYRKEIYEKLHEYFQTMDISIYENEFKNYYWWDEYIAIKQGDIKKVEKYFKTNQPMVLKFINYLKEDGPKMTIKKVFIVMRRKSKK